MKIKSAKKLGAKFHYKWSTHQPVTNAMLEVLKPELVVEIGTGRYSSPGLITSNALKTIHIDNEPGWIDLVKKENAEIITDKNEFRIHDIIPLGIASLKVLPSELNPMQKESIDNYHTELAAEIKAMNYKSTMIFTDGFASCRKSSVDLLTSGVDSMIFHDAEKPAAYGYDNLNKDLYNTHDEYLLRTAMSYTGFFVRKGIITFEDLKVIMDKHVNVYVESLGISKDGIELIQMPVQQ
jgi:hypothetical protein|tara:strand:+ start:1113 stop:1826 length:714 start_codon:yes stop_codon:yes gene_type:complete